MNIKRRIITIAGLAALAAGCTPTDATMGNAVRQTMAAQIVNPDPEYDNSIPTTDGAKGAAAVDRYRTDKVKQPDKTRTTSTQSGTPK